MNDLPSVTALGLPSVLADAAEASCGLILVGGTEHTGADMIVGALLAHVTQSGARHVVSVESSIQWDLPHGGGMVVQRELGTDIRPAPDAMEKALRSALRSGADVVALCTLTEPRAIDQCLVAAESSALVIAALPARGVVGTLTRLSQFLGRDRHTALTNALARCLRAVVSPARLRGTDGLDRWAHDLLIARKPAQEALADGDWDSVERLMQSGDEPDIRRLDDDLLRLARGGEIATQDALDVALDPRSLASIIE